MTEEVEIAKAANDGKLELICTEMQLLQCPSNHDVVLEGTGVIRADEQGRLSFHMVAPIRGMPHPALRRSRPHGQVYEIDDHVMLRAVDYRGREWRSNPLLVEPTYPASRSPNWVVRTEVAHLSYTFKRPHSDDSEGRLYIPQQRHLPFDAATHTTKSTDSQRIETGWALDHHIREIAESKVEFRSVDRHWLVIKAKQSKPVMPDWAGLICQALSFATATTIRPALAVREFHDRVHLGLFSGPFHRYQSSLPPPMIEMGAAAAVNFWALVQQFYEWSDRHEAEGEKLFTELEGIRSGSSGSIRTACLTLAIGIETIAGLLLRDEPVRKDKGTEDEIERLLTHLESWSGSAEVRSRAISMLSQMRRTRAVDRLYAFAERTGTPKKLVEAWKRLRDMKAHGATSEDDQKIYDLYYSAVELMYRLVCSTVGYTGLVVETSKQGWGLDEPLP